MDVELLHALRNSPVDPAHYPYLFKWLHLVKSNSEEERVRWPTTPGAAVSGRCPATSGISAAAYQTTPRGVVATEARMRRMLGVMGDSDLSPRSTGKPFVHVVSSVLGLAIPAPTFLSEFPQLRRNFVSKPRIATDDVVV